VGPYISQFIEELPSIRVLVFGFQQGAPDYQSRELAILADWLSQTGDEWIFPQQWQGTLHRIDKDFRERWPPPLTYFRQILPDYALPQREHVSRTRQWVRKRAKTLQPERAR
jgi:hypothetical protein